MISPMIGQRLGHYHVLEEIGRGGMGVVYLARDEHLQRDVAVKVLPPGALVDERARKRFHQEAEALSKLNHPNIQTVHDFDTQDGTDFLVMEYIPGSTLSEKLAAGPLPEPQVLELGTQLAEGLVTAHEQGVIHCDLKPGNLRVTPEGRLKILDFGLAKLLQPVSEFASTTSLSEHVPMGTLPYMAPEQLSGDQVDNRTDMWAAGAVLYEMTTGQRPFPHSRPPQLIDAILRQAPQAPSRVSRRLSPGLESVILKCLEKNPGHRYQSAKELCADFHRLSAGSEVVAVRRPVSAWRWGLAAAAAVVVVVLALLNLGGWRNRLSSTVTPPRIHSLAVLPLDNLSRDPDQEYFADGMTEALITELAQIKALKVISRTSTLPYRHTSKRLPQIAKELHVDAVVEGSVQRIGNRVGINVQLVDASDRQLRGANMERELSDILGLQREVAREIAGQIKVTLTAEEQAHLSSAPPVNPEANEAYLRGQYLFNTGTTEQKLKAKDYFERAIAIDPRFAAAYAGLADYYWGTTQLEPQASMPLAKQNALKAIELDPRLAHAHTALASIYFYADWKWADAEKEFQRATELNPNDAEAHRMYSVYLSAVGRGEAARAEIGRARELNPLSTRTQITAGWDFYFTHQYSQAIETCRAALDMEPNSFNAYDCLGLAHLAEGNYEPAIAACRRAVSLSGNDPVRAVGLGRAYARAGKSAEARQVLSVLSRRAQHSYVPPYYLATLHLALGDKKAALSWLEKAYRERDRYVAWIRVDPAVDPLRGDPGFQSLLTRLGFPQ